MGKWNSFSSYLTPVTVESSRFGLLQMLELPEKWRWVRGWGEPPHLPDESSV